MMAFVKRIRRILAGGLGSSKVVADGPWLLGEVRCHCKNCKNNSRGDTSYSRIPKFYALIDKAPVPVSND